MTDARKPKHEDGLEDTSPEELAAAVALREALERPSHSELRSLGIEAASISADAEFALSLRHAVHPAPLPADRHERILQRALAANPARPAHRRRWARAAFGATSALALAAAAILVVIRLDRNEMPANAEAPRIVPCRSAAGLFDSQFPVTGGTSERVERIALARERDLRDNLFARWHVR